MTDERLYELDVAGCKHSLTYSQLLGVIGDVVVLLRDTPMALDPSRLMHCPVDVVGFGLSARACNVLHHGGVRTLGDLVQKTSFDLLKMRHCGTRTVREIKEALARFGLVLRGEKSEVAS